MKCPCFAGHFLKPLPLDFPRHVGEVKPGANNPDLYLRGCDALLAPVDPLHTEAEEGKSGQGPSWWHLLLLTSPLLTLENPSQTTGIAET